VTPSRDLTDTSDSVRVIAGVAQAAAAGVLRNPSLYSVLVDLQVAGSTSKPVALRFGFHEVARRLMGGDRLKACWVDVTLHPRSVTAGPVGTFGRRQLEQMASIPGVNFPPPQLDLGALRLEPADVLRILADRPMAGSAEPARVDLSLFQSEGRLMWRVLQDVPAVGVRTLHVDAETGRVLLEKVDFDTNLGLPARPDGDG